MKADGPGAHIPVIVEDEEYGETIVNYFNKKESHGLLGF